MNETLTQPSAATVATSVNDKYSPTSRMLVDIRESSSHTITTPSLKTLGIGSDI